MFVSRSGRWAAAVVLAVVWATTPLHADAMTGSVPESSLCQVSTLTVTASPGLSLAVATSTQRIYLSLFASGTCDGITGAAPFSLQGSSTATPPATCADLVSYDGGGSFTYGGDPPYNVDYVLAGPTAAGTWVLTASSIAQVGAPVGVFDLAMSVNSLAACVAGTATSLSYTGVAVIAFS